jgi:hypothetical protein
VNRNVNDHRLEIHLKSQSFPITRFPPKNTFITQSTPLRTLRSVFHKFSRHPRQTLADLEVARAPASSVAMARVKHVGNRHNLSARGCGSHSRSNSFSHSSSNMSTEGAGSPPREATPTATASPPITSIPQKRALEDDHQPAISSPLNPDFKPQPSKHQDEAALARERAPRAKKESLKKRESKAGSLAPDTSARATPDPKAATSQKSKKHEAAPAPMRYKLPPPKLTDFEPPRGPIFIPSHVKTAPDGTEIQFNETTDQ